MGLFGKYYIVSGPLCQFCQAAPCRAGSGEFLKREVYLGRDMWYDKSAS